MCVNLNICGPLARINTVVEATIIGFCSMKQIKEIKSRLTFELQEEICVPPRAICNDIPRIYLQ